MRTSMGASYLTSPHISVYCKVIELRLQGVKRRSDEEVEVGVRMLAVCRNTVSAMLRYTYYAKGVAAYRLQMSNG